MPTPTGAITYREFLSVPPTRVFVIKWLLDSAELSISLCFRFFLLFSLSPPILWAVRTAYFSDRAIFYLWPPVGDLCLDKRPMPIIFRSILPWPLGLMLLALPFLALSLESSSKCCYSIEAAKSSLLPRDVLSFRFLIATLSDSSTIPLLLSYLELVLLAAAAVICSDFLGISPFL